MSLNERWVELVESHKTQEAMNKFWTDYFQKEKENYAKVLSEGQTVLEGTVSDLAASFNMDPVWFFGFMDGMNTSLTEPIELENIVEDTQVKLSIDLESLYFNMLDAKADWLYNLPEWDQHLTQERRKEITKEFRISKMAVSNKVGRNEPCPCGSGKKYKKCCGV